jgi:hypothetical protein
VGQNLDAVTLGAGFGSCQRNIQLFYNIQLLYNYNNYYTIIIIETFNYLTRVIIILFATTF